MCPGSVLPLRRVGNEGTERNGPGDVGPCELTGGRSAAVGSIHHRRGRSGFSTAQSWPDACMMRLRRCDQLLLRTVDSSVTVRAEAIVRQFFFGLAALAFY